LFDVEEVDSSFLRVVPRKRGPIRPIVGVPNADANIFKKAVFSKFGLSQYNDCWTFEMSKRPIPFVSTDSKPKIVADDFKKYIDAVMDVLVPMMKPHIQTYNKISKLGWPVLANPKDELGVQIKMEVLEPFFSRFDVGDFSGFTDAFNTINVRLQNEPPDKKRVFQFIKDDGSIYEEEIDRRNYTGSWPDLGTVVPSRTRTVVNPALVNLYLQVWDTMLHRAIMSFPLCEANVYNRIVWPRDSRFRTFDCKHYERYLGMLVKPYCEYIGGRYGEWLYKIATDPYLVPSDTRKTCWLIKPKYSDSVFPQFGSGLCCVSTLGKLANICVQVGYFVEERNLPVSDAVYAVLNGEFNGLRRWQYGDDNRVMGPDSESDPFFARMGARFDIEEDEVPKFLGTVYRPDLGRFVLPKETYILKFPLKERDWSFTDYPNLGIVARRDTFKEYGEPEITTKIIPFEDEQFNLIGHPFFEFISRGIKEKREADMKGISLTKLQLTDKEYLMTEDESMASGTFWGISSERTKRIVLSLVSDRIRKKLKFT